MKHASHILIRIPLWQILGNLREKLVGFLLVWDHGGHTILLHVVLHIWLPFPQASFEWNVKTKVDLIKKRIWLSMNLENTMKLDQNLLAVQHILGVLGCFSRLLSLSLLARLQSLHVLLELVTHLSDGCNSDLFGQLSFLLLRLLLCLVFDSEHNMPAQVPLQEKQRRKKKREVCISKNFSLAWQSWLRSDSPEECCSPNSDWSLGQGNCAKTAAPSEPVLGWNRFAEWPASKLPWCKGNRRRRHGLPGHPLLPMPSSYLEAFCPSLQWDAQWRSLPHNMWDGLKWKSLNWNTSFS